MVGKVNKNIVLFSWLQDFSSSILCFLSFQHLQYSTLAI